MAGLEKLLSSKQDAAALSLALRTQPEEQPITTLPRLLTTKEAAELLHKSAGTLRYWRCVGFGPAYAKLGKTVVYDIGDLVSFVRANTVRPSVRDASMEETNGSI